MGRVGRVAKQRVAAVLCGVLLAGSACSDPPKSAPPQNLPAQNSPDPHASHSIAPAAPLRDGERFVTVSMPEPYTPAAPSGGTDEYRCFLVDPGLTRTAFLTGSQFLPQNAAIVHHA